MNSTEFCELLKNQGIDIYLSVPCSIFKSVLNHMEKNPEFECIIATREDEAIGVAIGAYMGGRKPIVLMQNSGIGNSVNAWTSLTNLYKFPIPMIISWRGHPQENDAPEHLIMGVKCIDLLKALEIPTIILSKDKIEEQVKESLKVMREGEMPVAMILRGGILDE